MPEDQNNAGGNNAGGQPPAGTGTPPAGSTQTPPPANPPSGAGGAGTQTPATGGTQTGDQSTGTIAGAPGAKDAGTTQTPPPTGEWAADWRQKASGNNADLLKLAERYSTPGDLLNALNNAQKKIDSGAIKQPLPKDATPEQLAAYRKENGVPEAAEKYDLALPDGLVIGESDKPIIDGILSAMHGKNASQEMVTGFLTEYYKQEKVFQAKRETDIADNKRSTDDQLHREWGDEYRGEINRIENLLSTFSPETQAVIQYGVDDKGMPLLNNPHFLKDLAVNARMVNPVSTILPGAGAGTATSVDTEIATIEKRMAEDRDGYFKDNAMQARYRDLLTWKENQKTRAGQRAA
jgi:hypothetical protein